MVMVVLIMSGNGMVAPMLSIYAQQFGVSGTLIGMMITLFGVGRLLANVPAGILSERFGRRLFLCVGPALIAIGSVGAAIATDFEVLLAWRFVQGLGSGIYMTVSATVAVQVSKPGERGRTMALFQGCLLLGSSIGPAIGGFLAERFGFAAPFWAYAAVAVVALVLALTTFREPPPAVAQHSTAGPASIGSLLKSPAFILLGIITFGIFFTRTAAMWLLIPLIGHDNFGLSVDVIGLALTIAAVANLAMLPIVGPIIDRVGARPITVVATVVTGLGLALIALASGEPIFWVAMVILGVAGGFNGPSVTSAMADLVPPNLYGPAMGMQRAAGDAGFILGPILVGLIYDFTSTGHIGGLLANSLLMIVSGLLVLVAGRRFT